LGNANYELIFAFYWDGGHFFGQGRWSDMRWFTYDDLKKGSVDWSHEFDRGWRAEYLYGLMYVRVDSECHQLGTPITIDVKTEYFKVGTGYRTSLTDNYRQVKGRFKAGGKASAIIVD